MTRCQTRAILLLWEYIPQSFRVKWSLRKKCISPCNTSVVWQRPRCPRTLPGPQGFLFAHRGVSSLCTRANPWGPGRERSGWPFASVVRLFPRICRVRCHAIRKALFTRDLNVFFYCSICQSFGKLVGFLNGCWTIALQWYAFCIFLSKRSKIEI